MNTILVTKKVKSKKPVRNEQGYMSYKDAFQYLARILDQDEPCYSFILGLANYATQYDCLTKKQAKKADEIIYYFEERGIL